MLLALIFIVAFGLNGCKDDDKSTNQPAIPQYTPINIATTGCSQSQFIKNINVSEVVVLQSIMDMETYIPLAKAICVYDGMGMFTGKFGDGVLYLLINSSPKAVSDYTPADTMKVYRICNAPKAELGAIMDINAAALLQISGKVSAPTWKSGNETPDPDDPTQVCYDLELTSLGWRNYEEAKD